MNGCYGSAGNCNNFFLTDVTIVNTTKINCEIFGIYVHNEKNSTCCILDDTHNKYLVNSVHAMYSKYNNNDKCYTQSNVNANGKLGLIFTIVSVILFLVPTCLMAIVKLIECKNNQERKLMTKTIEIQFGGAFQNDSQYLTLSGNNNNSHSHIYGLLRTDSENSCTGRYTEL